MCCVSDFGSMEKILFQNYELDIGHDETNMHFYYSHFSQYVLEIITHASLSPPPFVCRLDFVSEFILFDSKMLY